MGCEVRVVRQGCREACGRMSSLFDVLYGMRPGTAEQSLGQVHLCSFHEWWIATHKPVHLVVMVRIATTKKGRAA